MKGESLPPVAVQPSPTVAGLPCPLRSSDRPLRHGWTVLDLPRPCAGDALSLLPLCTYRVCTISHRQPPTREKGVVIHVFVCMSPRARGFFSPALPFLPLFVPVAVFLFFSFLFLTSMEAKLPAGRESCEQLFARIPLGVCVCVCLSALRPTGGAAQRFRPPFDGARCHLRLHGGCAGTLPLFDAR